MKTLIFFLCIVCIELFSQINPNEFPKIGYADMYWLVKKYGVNYSADQYFYPKLVELGLTHTVSYGDPIPLNPSYNTQIKIMDNNFPRNANWTYNNPFKYANSVGNYTNNFAYELGGGVALLTTEAHKFGMGSNGTTSWWIYPYSQSYNFDKNFLDSENNRVYRAALGTHQPGIMMMAGFDPTHQPWDNKWDHIFYYKLFIKAKIDGALGADVVARVHIWTEQTVVEEITRNRLFEEVEDQLDDTQVDFTYDITANQFIGNQYITLPSNSFRILGQKPDNLKRVWVTIEWMGNRTLYIDNIAMCNTFYETLFVQNSQTARQSIANDLQSLFGNIKNNPLFSHPYNDEPFPLMYRGVGEVSSIAEQVLVAGKYVNGATMGLANNELMLGNSQRRMPYVLYDLYPIKAFFDSVSYGEHSIQFAFDSLVHWNASVGYDVLRSWGLREAIQVAQNYSPQTTDDIPLYHTIQVQGEKLINNIGGNITIEPIFRVPTFNEILAQGNLSLCYGAKGIMYFLIMTDAPTPAYNSSSRNYYGLFEEEGNLGATFQNPANHQVPNYRFNAVKSLNQYIDKIKAVLLQLTWINGFSIHKGQPTGTFVTSVTTTDAASERYVELGLFKDVANIDYFMLVNRRTLSNESRNITVSLNNSGFKEILEVASGKKFIIGSNGTFTDTFTPGEGKLYKVSPLSYSWTGNITVMNTVTVPSGTTLTVSPNTSIFFANGTSLTVNGTLNATGTPSNKIKFDRSGTTGNWGSIIFDGASSSNSVSDYVEIKNASAIQCLNNASITIQNSVIQNCIQGIYIYNSEPKIFNNQIIDPLQNGIHGITSADEIEIYDNTIIKNTGNSQYKQYQGIWFENNSLAFIGHNDVKGFYWGMYYGGGSVGYFFDPTGYTFNPNNRVTYCRRGIGVGWGSYCLGGYGTLGANNTIMNNDWNDLYVYQSSSVWAQYNYFGGNAGLNYVDGTSTLHDDYYLPEDPWGGSLQTLLAKNSNLDLVTGLELEREGNLIEAVSHYKQMVNKNSYPSFALTRLAFMKKRYSIDNIQSYFETFLTGESYHKAIVLNLLAGIYLRNDKYNEAINLYDTIIDQYPNSYASVNTKFEKFFATLNYAKNSTLASNILSEIQSLNLTEEEYLMRLKFADYLLNSFGSYGSQYLGKSSNSNQKNVQESLPKECSLLENYPNHFNPTTKISYQLPNAALVTLKVYDLLGREVATLVNEEKQPGKYEVEFEASSLSSGIYLYRIIINDFVKTMKMIVVK